MDQAITRKIRIYAWIIRQVCDARTHDWRFWPKLYWNGVIMKETMPEIITTNALLAYTTLKWEDAK